MGGVGGNADEVDVADGFFAAADAAAGLEAADGGALLCEGGDEAVADGLGAGDGHAGGFGALELDLAGDVFGGFFAEPGEGGEAAVLGGDFQLGDGGDVKFMPDALDGFGA